MKYRMCCFVPEPLGNIEKSRNRVRFEVFSELTLTVLMLLMLNEANMPGDLTSVECCPL